MSEQPPAPEPPAPEPAAPEHAPEPAAAQPPAPESAAAEQREAGGIPARSRGRALLESVVEGNSVTVTILAIFTAMVIGGLLNAFTNTTVLHAWNNLFSAPGAAFAKAWHVASGAYVALFEGAIVNPHTVAAMFQQASISTAIHNGYLGAVFGPIAGTCILAAPLMLAGLAVALPYQAGMFNIGGQSQFIGGAILATYLGYGVSLPPFVHVVVVLLGGFAGGAVIGWVAGALKAYTGAHEVITTIMLNYVMAFLLSFLLGNVMQRPGRTDLISPFIANDARLPQLFGANLGLHAGFLIALAAAVAVWWLLSRTTTGFEFRAIGKNPSAARVAGIRVERSWIMVMLIAGGCAGLAACMVVQGTDYTITFQSYGTYGIDAITVALLGRGRSLGVVLAALLFGALYSGAPQMQVATSTPVDMVSVLQALIVMFVAAPPLIRAIYRLRATRAAGVGQVLSKGWNA